LSERITELKRQGNRALTARKYEEARAAFSALISESPESPEGYLGLAKTLERTHDHRSIISLIEPVVSRMRTPPLLRTLGDAYRVVANQGDPTAVDPAIRWYTAYLTERPDAVVYFYLGELYREHKHDDIAALEHLKASWSLDPGSRTVYQAALASAKRLGRLDEVRQLMDAWKESGRE
jgi:tetratricopeptide (TPR) repeat protein